MVSIFHLKLQIFFLTQRRFSSAHFSVLFQWGGAQCPPTAVLSSTMELFWGQSVCSVSPLCRDLAPAKREANSSSLLPLFSSARSSFHPAEGTTVEQCHHNLQPTSEGCTLTCLLFLLSGEILAPTSLGLDFYWKARCGSSLFLIKVQPSVNQRFDHFSFSCSLGFGI